MASDVFLFTVKETKSTNPVFFFIIHLILRGSNLHRERAWLHTEPPS